MFSPGVSLHGSGVHVPTLLSNPEVLRQLQTLQQQMSQQQHELEEKVRKLQEMKQQEDEFDKHLAQTVPDAPKILFPSGFGVVFFGDEANTTKETSYSTWEPCLLTTIHKTAYASQAPIARLSVCVQQLTPVSVLTSKLAPLISNLPFASECDLKPSESKPSAVEQQLPSLAQMSHFEHQDFQQNKPAYIFPGMDMSQPPPGYSHPPPLPPPTQEESSLEDGEHVDSELEYIDRPGHQDTSSVEIINLDRSHSRSQSPGSTKGYRKRRSLSRDRRRNRRTRSRSPIDDNSRSRSKRRRYDTNLNLHARTLALLNVGSPFCSSG
uniref:Uncharacterized protein n=1 Tax=Timema poppense TaxID=170557 RepID=A0A7R9D980_TIMPO|nr:unnamed protein product [Timema poppensis]